jgi:outer membrane protein TolC
MPSKATLAKKNNQRNSLTMKLLKTIFCLLACYVPAATAQVNSDSLFVLPDSVKGLSIDHFYSLVLTGHPVAKQAELLNEFARQELRLARGAFDPKLEAQYLTKNFGGTEYYNVFNAAVKMPSVLPFDPSIGIERNSGKYLNPERYISDEYNYRQFYAGVSLPLGRGLITDERRAALKQADLFGDLMQAEQVKILNKLFFEAAKDYWQWAISYYNFRLYDQGVGIASEILRRVKLNNQLGEASAMDTIQATITFQQRLVERQEAWLEFQNSTIQISSYLWDSVGNPVEIPFNFAPVMTRQMLGISQAEIVQLTDAARLNHPEVTKLNVKLEQLDVDRRLAKEFLKPRLDLNYYLLNQPISPEGSTGLDFNDNYKLGVDFSFPIFLRKERAKLSQAKLKISNTKLDLSITQRQIFNQINTAYNELTNNGKILAQQTQMVDSYDKLLSAELFNLENGESDLFKINIQIEKLIQSQAKLIKLLGDYEKDRAFLYWSAGVRRLN